jgi:hypothetical protein
MSNKYAKVLPEVQDLIDDGIPVSCRYLSSHLRVSMVEVNAILILCLKMVHAGRLLLLTSFILLVTYILSFSSGPWNTRPVS